MKVRAFNSLGSQLGLTRFEIRLLKHFHDYCIPLLTITKNSQPLCTWDKVIPQYFVQLKLIRQSVFAFSCLQLWVHVDLEKIFKLDEAIESLHSLDVDIDTETDSRIMNIHTDHNLLANLNDNLFNRTTAYFMECLRASRVHASHALVDKHSMHSNLLIIYLSSFLVFSYLGLHPHCVLPLVDYNNNPPSDIIAVGKSMRDVMLLFPEEVKFDVLLRLSDTIAYSEIEKLNEVSFIADMRTQLDDFYFQEPVLDILIGESCAEHSVLRSTLSLFEVCYRTAIDQQTLEPLFKCLILLDADFGEIVRSGNYFAAKIIFVLSCLIHFCHYHVHAESSTYKMFIDDFVSKHLPLCPFDQAFYDELVRLKRKIDFEDVRKALQDLDDSAFYRVPSVDSWSLPSAVNTDFLMNV